MKLLFPCRFLSVLTTCLDLFLFLESRYNVVDALLSLQQLDTTDSGLGFIPNPMLDFCFQ